MYGKLFSQMYDGTLATKGPWQALVTFQQLIILADKHGIVDMTPEAIGRRTTNTAGNHPRRATTSIRARRGVT
jgi:hypothetical protein